MFLWNTFSLWRNRSLGTLCPLDGNKEVAVQLLLHCTKYCCCVKNVWILFKCRVSCQIPVCFASLSLWLFCSVLPRSSKLEWRCSPSNCVSLLFAISLSLAKCQTLPWELGGRRRNGFRDLRAPGWKCSMLVGVLPTLRCSSVWVFFSGTRLLPSVISRLRLP